MENEKKWNPIKDQILTRWVKDIDPNQPHPEYPRPQLKREEWLNLNGMWDYAICPKDTTEVTSYDGKILVPYPIESALSGVGKKVKPNQRIWYHRKFSFPEKWQGKRILLHFGAVDWETKVIINGNYIGEHKGGYTPFKFEISKNLNMGENDIIISVWDPTDKGKQEHGKQSLRPKIIFYTAISGIWQTVWLEPVLDTYIEGNQLTPDIDNESITIDTKVNNYESDDKLEYVIIDKEHGNILHVGNVNQKHVINIKSPKLWSIDNPFLYDIIIRIKRDNKTIDEVYGYFGMRKISLSKKKEGVIRIELNNNPLFQYGTLDQGYWPDGLYTAPTDDALKYDIQITKDLGFNMIRKHVKVEPARWYHHCDKIGILVWQDMPNGGVIDIGNQPTNINEYKTKREEDDKLNYYNELEVMVDKFYNFPSIIVWVPFNEGWGQFDTKDVTERIRKLDSSRLINSASGWYDHGIGDIYDIHRYPSPIMPNIDNAKSRALVVGEFGGIGLDVENHMWNTTEKFVYRNFSDSDKLTRKYERFIKKLQSLIENGLSAAIYTQITDVEGEVNGLLTYDREIIKIDQDRLNKLNTSLFE
ncbi:MAG: glycoside hydrolase family 2 protein [Promethearchaeota archaeon]